MAKALLLFVVITAAFGIYVGSKAAEMTARMQAAHAEQMANY